MVKHTMLSWLQVWPRSNPSFSLHESVRTLFDTAPRRMDYVCERVRPRWRHSRRARPGSNEPHSAAATLPQPSQLEQHGREFGNRCPTRAWSAGRAWGHLENNGLPFRITNKAGTTIASQQRCRQQRIRRRRLRRAHSETLPKSNSLGCARQAEWWRCEF